MVSRASAKTSVLEPVLESVLEKKLYSTRSECAPFWQRIFERNEEGEKKARRRPPRPSSTFFETDEVAAKKVRQKAQIVTASSIPSVLQQIGEMAERVRSRMAGVKHTLAVMSGKGGVGKSLVTAGLAQAFTERGLRVGVVDADVNGPCVPRMLGITGSFGVASPDGIQPAVGHGGVKVASMGLLLDTADRPVDWKTPAPRTLRSAWRGAIEMTTLRELVSDVVWDDLDVLLFDLPPGIGDKEEVLLSWLPTLGGAVFVTTPSPLVLEVVKRSIRFATQIGIRVIGVISNLDPATCPHCGKSIAKRRNETDPAQLSRLGAPLLGRLPYDPELARLGDEGLPLFRSGGVSSAEAFRVLAQRIWDCLECRPADYL